MSRQKYGTLFQGHVDLDFRSITVTTLEHSIAQPIECRFVPKNLTIQFFSWFDCNLRMSQQKYGTFLENKVF